LDDVADDWSGAPPDRMTSGFDNQRASSEKANANKCE
jgi:hypothetical protein